MADDTATAFDKLAAELAGEGFTPGSMFGLRSLKYGGKAVVALHDDGVAFKLVKGSDAHTAAGELPGAGPFDPAGGRPMKDWVRLGADTSAHWPELSRQAGAAVPS